MDTSTTYVCFTVYHLLVALSDIFVHQRKANILLEKRMPNLNILKQNIEKYCDITVTVFDDKVIFPTKKSLLFNQPNDLSILEILKKENIVLFNDLTFISYLLIKNKKTYKLYEDGLDYFKCKLVLKNNLKTKIITKINGLPLQMGSSKFCTKIFVNSCEALESDHRHSKMETMCKNKLFNDLSQQSLDIIMKIFNVQKVEIEENAVLILTQPLFNDGIFKTAQQQIEFYQNKVDQYQKKW